MSKGRCEVGTERYHPLPRDKGKRNSKDFKKPLDKKQILCYNKDVRKRKENLNKPER